MPEWLKGADCKSAGFAYVGSNPTPSTNLSINGLSGMTDVAPHAWFEPKLAALMAEARTAGIAQDMSVAVITDLVNGKLAGAAVPPPEESNPDQDLGEPGYMVPHGPDTGLADTGEAVGNPLNHLGHNRWGR